MKIKLFIPICFLLIAIMGIGFASAADINNNTPSIEGPHFTELVDNSSNVIVDSGTPVNIDNDKENLYDYKDTNSSATFSNNIVDSVSNNTGHGPKIAPELEIKCLNSKLPGQLEIENDVQKYSRMLNLKQEIKDCFDLIIEVYYTHGLSDTVKICADVLTLNKYNNKVYTCKDIRVMMLDMLNYLDI